MVKNKIMEGHTVVGTFETVSQKHVRNTVIKPEGLIDDILTWTEIQKADIKKLYNEDCIVINYKII